MTIESNEDVSSNNSGLKGINTTLVVIVARGDSLAHKFGTHKFGRSAQIRTNSK